MALFFPGPPPPYITLEPLIVVVIPAPPFKPDPAFWAPPPPPAPQLFTFKLQGFVDVAIVAPAFAFPLVPPVKDVRSGATPPVTETEPKLELPPFVPLSGVYPVALSEILAPLQLIKAAEPAAPTLIATAAAGVKDSVVKLTPPPPPPAP